mmetsp:Transcript_90332/g.179762  ORF Transcript_90332/g.179762 Transcript_90332/m.179762 type:complete len:97 (+) Transcript_90332:429-719(+)
MLREYLTTSADDGIQRSDAKATSTNNCELQCSTTFLVISSLSLLVFHVVSVFHQPTSGIRLVLAAATCAKFQKDVQNSQFILGFSANSFNNPILQS